MNKAMKIREKNLENALHRLKNGINLEREREIVKTDRNRNIVIEKEREKEPEKESETEPEKERETEPEKERNRPRDKETLSEKQLRKREKQRA